MSDQRSLLLNTILPLVPFDGWSEYALRQGAKKISVNEAVVFPGGMIECMDYFFTKADAALERAFPNGALIALRLPERVEKLIIARLEYFLPHREAVRRAVAARALPWNAARAFKSVYHSVDLMWHLAGDRSTDFNFYTKRMTLGAVYMSTLLFWLNDNSENYVATHTFLKHRLIDINAFGKWKKSIKTKLSAFIVI